MKPCPFCGAHVDKDHFVYGVTYNSIMDLWVFDHICHYDDNHDLDVTMTVYGKTKEEVIERWNRRAEIQKSESL